MDNSETTSEKMPSGQMLEEILQNSRKANLYLKWQLYITIVLVVIPLLALVFLVPYVFHSIIGSYSQVNTVQ